MASSGALLACDREASAGFGSLPDCHDPPRCWRASCLIAPDAVGFVMLRAVVIAARFRGYSRLRLEVMLRSSLADSCVPCGKLAAVPG